MSTELQSWRGAFFTSLQRLWRVTVWISLDVRSLYTAINLMQHLNRCQDGSFTLPQPCGGYDHNDTVIWQHPFLSYPGFCCLWQQDCFYSQRPQLVRLPLIVLLLGATLSQTPPLLLYASPLCWLSEPLFLSENLYEATERNETRGRQREGRRGTQRQSGRVKLWFFWSCDRCCQCVSALHTLPAKTRALLICSHIFKKKWILS